ncbi:MAG TPA: ECF-type sigma factor, partial [Pyrinomonadaceae bacterium]|nr:ECF-type sigma factor [Pyrinomonadaceae bacterium]
VYKLPDNNSLSENHQSITQDSGAITGLLCKLEYNREDSAATDELFARVYDELRKMAGGFLRHERADHTLQPTALVHEVYLRLTGGGEVIDFQNRAHFFSIAAEVMRHILVDYARRHRAGKRGGGEHKLALDEIINFSAAQNIDLIRLDEALKELAKLDARHAKIVELKFFGGLTMEEIAAAVGEQDIEKIGREWRKAKMWLKQNLSQK